MRQWLRETHGPFFELFRHFLRNFFSNDLVSNPRQANAAALIAIVPVLFQWFFLLIMPLNAKYAHLSALPNPGPYRDAVMEGWPVIEEQSGTEHGNRQIQAQTLQANLATFAITSAEYKLVRTIRRDMSSLSMIHAR